MWQTNSWKQELIIGRMCKMLIFDNTRNRRVGGRTSSKIIVHISQCITWFISRWRKYRKCHQIYENIHLGSKVNLKLPDCQHKLKVNSQFSRAFTLTMHSAQSDNIFHMCTYKVWTNEKLQPKQTVCCLIQLSLDFSSMSSTCLSHLIYESSTTQHDMWVCVHVCIQNWINHFLI